MDMLVPLRVSLYTVYIYMIMYVDIRILCFFFSGARIEVNQ